MTKHTTVIPYMCRQILLKPVSKTTHRHRHLVTTSSKESIQSILQNVQNGSISIIKAEERLLHSLKTKNTSIDTNKNINVLEAYANIDHHRSERAGFPEAVFAQGKTPEQVVSILDNMADHINTEIILKEQEKDGDNDSNYNIRRYNPILATRVDINLWEQIQKLPIENGTLTYHSTAKIVIMHPSHLSSDTNTMDVDNNNETNVPKIIVACAGTTDIPIAEEAVITLQSTKGCKVERVYDVGVAGLHRILNAIPKLHAPDVKCIIVCAGMDGALPSVVAGLVKIPVIAVPTSVGYGASFGGVSALLTMLNSCAPGVGVVNIDNGFGAAALAFKCIQE